MTSTEPSAPPSHRIDRRSSLIAGLAGALVGALAAGIFTFMATNMQIDSSREQAQSEFLHSQQVAAYTSFLGNISKLQSIDSRNNISLWSREAIPTEEASEKFYSAVDALDQVQSAQATLSLLAPADTVLASQELTLAVARWDDPIQLALAKTSTTGLTQDEIDALSNTVMSAKQEVDTKMRAFMNLARRDLQN